MIHPEPLGGGTVPYCPSRQLLKERRIFTRLANFIQHIFFYVDLKQARQSTFNCENNIDGFKYFFFFFCGGVTRRNRDAQGRPKSLNTTPGTNGTDSACGSVGARERVPGSVPNFGPGWVGRPAWRRLS